MTVYNKQVPLLLNNSKPLIIIMFKSTFYLFILFFYFNINPTSSQSLVNQNINDQFKTVVDGSNNFQEYKVIKQTQIKALWKNTIDSLNAKDRALTKTSQELSSLKASISSKEKSLLEKEENVKRVLDSANEITFLGFISLTKSNYKIFMWTIVLVLIVIGGFLFFQAKSARKEARYRSQLFEETTEEYKNFKIKSNENEKKLARLLQDERNKLAEHNIR